ncbi:hypothetical protein D0Y65_042029 [Glycine soja]|uniref:Uncharacterized protein n=1 Tax=Glycine soja TaxID=3848 RepID=A0A445GY86_GLYSO|nr:hypothetical protein D0Y65_042029 [Glycine soja]
MASSLLLAMVLVLDLVAFALAVAAEQTRNTVPGAVPWHEYSLHYMSQDNLDLSSLVMVVTRCMCCGRAMRPSGSRSWSICLFISLAETIGLFSFLGNVFSVSVFYLH